MHRQLARYSYWVGVVCVVIDVLWRALGLVWTDFPESFHGLWRTSFRNAAFVFLMLSVASAAYSWLQQQNSSEGSQKKAAGAS